MPESHPSTPRRSRRGNERPIVISQAEAEQFWLSVEEQPSGCWEWQGNARVDGYGIYRAHGLNFRAHRVSWTIAHGPLDQWITIDHLCRNRACVNPAHLEAVTNAENILRGASPTAANARKTHCKYGHAFTPENTRNRRGRRECVQCIRDKRARTKDWRSGKHASATG